MEEGRKQVDAGRRERLRGRGTQRGLGVMNGTLCLQLFGRLRNLADAAFASNQRQLPVNRLKHQFLEENFYFLKGNA